MVCNKFSSFKGCGKCEVSLTNYEQIKKLSVLTITDIVSNLFEFCKEDRNKKLQLSDSTIDCRGSMSMSYGDDTSKDYIIHNRKECQKFIRTWSQYHKPIFVNAISIIYLYRCKNILGSIQSSNEMMNQANQLEENMIQMVQDLEAF